MLSTSVTLLERVRERTDAAAWDRFVRLYTPFLYHCALKLGLHEADAADAVQEVFILLWAKLPDFQYEDNGSFRGWLRTVTVNKCRERHRKRHEVAAGGSEADLRFVADDCAGSDWWDAEHSQHLVARVLEFIQSEFEATTWQAFWQTTVEALPAAEVARELGLTVNAVYVARSRVLRRLRDEVRGLLDE